ncbi:hypothetical protein D3C86_1703390 [compost metagenome]
MHAAHVEPRRCAVGIQRDAPQVGIDRLANAPQFLIGYCDLVPAQIIRLNRLSLWQQKRQALLGAIEKIQRRAEAVAIVPAREFICDLEAPLRLLPVFVFLRPVPQTIPQEGGGLALQMPDPGLEFRLEHKIGHVCSPTFRSEVQLAQQPLSHSMGTVRMHR